MISMTTPHKTPDPKIQLMNESGANSTRVKSINYLHQMMSEREAKQASKKRNNMNNSEDAMCQSEVRIRR